MDGDDQVAFERPFPVTELLGALSFILIGAIAFAQMKSKTAIAVKDPLTPFGLPRGLAGIMVILGLWLMPWGELLERLRRLSGRVGDPPRDRSSEEAPTRSSWRGWTRTYLPLSGIVAYAFALPRLGFVVSTTVLGWVMLPVMGSRRRVTLILPPVTAMLLWLVFGKLLRVNLPSGLFF